MSDFSVQLDELFVATTPEALLIVDLLLICWLLDNFCSIFNLVVEGFDPDLVLFSKMILSMIPDELSATFFK